jgi:hypothetical protein
MSVRYLAETSVREIQSLIKAEISTALSDLRIDRGDAKVSTEVPQSYFIYEQAKAYKTPACFVICRDMNFQKDQLGANFITAKAGIVVSIVVEDKDREKLTVKAWRYQAALHSILDQRSILVTPNKAKITIIVTDALFSPTFTSEGSKGSEGVFRQEMALTLEVQHREGF